MRSDTILAGASYQDLFAGRDTDFATAAGVSLASAVEHLIAFVQAHAKKE